MSALQPEANGVTGPRGARVLHIITRMIVGGAQETPMLTCQLIDQRRFPSELLTGPQTGPEGELITESRVRGVTVHIEPDLVREVSPLRDLKAIVHLVRRLRRDRYQIVHTHSSKAGIVGRIAAWLARVPVVVHTVHGWGFNDEQPAWESGGFLALERLCAPITRALIVVGAPYRDEGLQLGIGRPSQYHLIRSGIEVDQYRTVALDRRAARERLGLPVDAFIVGNVGRLSPPKCPELMIAALDRLSRQKPDAHLVLVGDGWQRAEVEAEVSRLGLGDRVHLLGLRRDVPEILRAFDVFVLSSSREGLPRVLPQAMAAGLPIVATRVGGVPDAVHDGVNGLLVASGDSVALGDALLRLANDPGLVRAMGERGAAMVEEFSAPRMVEQLEELYASLLDAAGKPS